MKLWKFSTGLYKIGGMIVTYGYIRVSTDAQDVENQKIGISRRAAELQTPIDEWIADEGVSGTKEYKDRELGVLMEKLKDGDVLIVSEISRLARSVFMLFRIVEHCTQTRNCVIHSVKESQVLRKNDVVSAIILSAYGTAAQIEREMIVKRTIEGLERRRQMGVVFGRPVGSKNKPKEANAANAAIIDKVRELSSKGVCVKAIAKMAGIHRSTVYNIMERNGIPHKKGKSHENKYSMKPILEKEKEFIGQMIADGKRPEQIRESLKGKGIQISEASLRSYIKRFGLYDLMLQKNHEARAIGNVSCGRGKAFFRRGEYGRIA